jgi:hypothetical protein
MLPVGGLLLLDDVGYPAIAKVVRFATANLGYVEESRPDVSPGGQGRAARVRRRLRRAATIPAALGFVLADERRETPGVELPYVREVNLAVLRKVAEDARRYDHYVPF